MVWLTVSPLRRKIPRSIIHTSTIRSLTYMTPTEKNIVSSCNSGCLLIFSYGRAHAWCDYLSHLPDKNPEINSHQHAAPYNSCYIPKKNIMSSCNLRCVLIFPYGRARAWCGYLSQLLDKNPRDQFPPASSTIRFLAYTQEKILCLAAICAAY